MSSVCEVASCTRETYRNSPLCQAHYVRLQRHGDVREHIPLKAKYGSLRPEFDRLTLIETDECVLWPFAVTSGGYGLVPDGCKHIYAHRLALLRREPPVPPNTHAIHGPCHNRRCINYRHLHWGTNHENILDRFRDGTSNQGERHGLSKLTEAQVIEIRASSQPSGVLTEMYPVSRTTIDDIKAGRSWKHLL